MARAAAGARAGGSRIETEEPACVALWREGGLAERVEALRAALGACRLCPRACGADRLTDRIGSCGTGRYAIVSSAYPHLGEEDCLRGWRGSGTIFFSLCSLRCAFCQNADISWHASGEVLDAGQLAAVILGLQARGCHNLNLVTPTHVAAQVAEALEIAVTRGFGLPVVYNTSGYDTVETLRLLEGLVDVYMPDFKFWREETAARYAHAPDYPSRAREAILEMHRQVGPLRFGPDSLARRGVLVRHLVMPGLLEESAAIFSWLAREVSPDTFVNVMGQYRPAWLVGEPDGTGCSRFKEIDRRPRAAEIEAAYQAARYAGLSRFAERLPGPRAVGS